MTTEQWPASEWKIGEISAGGRLLHCFGCSPDEQLTADQAARIVKASGTGFITLYTHQDLSGASTHWDLPLGYAGLTLADLRSRLDVDRYTLLINTNYATTVQQAVERAERVRELTGGASLAKLEVWTDDESLIDNQAVQEAAQILIDRGFTVIALINLDLADATCLESMGCVALRVPMAPIGSLGGLPQLDHYAELVAASGIPVIAEGGLRDESDGFYAMSSGASAAAAAGMNPSPRLVGV